jgi:hypothetical protein
MARCAVGRSGVRARSARRAACSGDVALIARRAGDWGRSGARPGLARVRLGARIPVAAGRSVRSGRVRTRSGRRVAGARAVALVEGGADDWVRSRARSALAYVGLVARVRARTRCPIRNGRIRAGAAARVARPRGVTLVAPGARDGIAPSARPAQARVGLSAGVPVAARGAVRRRRVRAGPRARIARPGDVALVARRARDGGTCASAILTRVRPGARVAVVAGGPVRCRRVRASPRARIARPGNVALIARRTCDGGACAGAVLARVRLGARVAVVASGPVRRGRV